MPSSILAIDQGTSSSRAIIFDKNLEITAISQQEFQQHYPQSGWVEHEPEDLWKTTVQTCRAVMEQSNLHAGDIGAIGITNQRETTLIWDRESGEPIHRAIVWQDRRTSEQCALLKAAGHEELITAKTGLLLDPYFSGTKISWILDHVDGARQKAEAGQLAFGTVDSFLLWRLTGGKVHATDATNASRTLLFNIQTGEWDPELLEFFNVPASMLPEVRDCAADYGTTLPGLFGGPIRICGIAGDQQAALVGQACFQPGMLKSTYGTGCFAMLNTGPHAVSSKNRLLSTIAYQLDGQRCYALEGSIFIAGAAIQWLRDGLGILEKASDAGSLARKSDSGQNVYLVPAFTGLGAPYWDAEARGAMFGLTRGTGPAEFARAALESVCYQTRDLLEAMQGDWDLMAEQETVLRVDGGMVASDWTMQFLADILNAPVDRPKILETTALGAAYHAGFHIGMYPSPPEFAESWKRDVRFKPSLDEEVRTNKYRGWQDAVQRTLSRN
ncbi:MAG TPA: glycerol kinase GlpK [Desulfobacterales bacterium]|nr:glycerol kinase GlpK [Desulfobacterales bacterium]HIP37919.1 glycerol kinase [Desulfocapsa sulfexigens]